MPSIQAPVYTTYTRSEENEGTLKISDQKKKKSLLVMTMLSLLHDSALNLLLNKNFKMCKTSFVKVSHVL